MENAPSGNPPTKNIGRISDLAQLTKTRLTLLVVFSASMSFVIGSGSTIDWVKLLLLLLGGFLVTGSANAFNQIMEKDLDKLMDRTQARPLPDQRMRTKEAMVVAILFGAVGLFILTYYMNFISGVLGLIALLSYTVMYTPLKRSTPFAVFVGAFPGAIPTLLGYVAATGRFDSAAWILFCIQFIWQFPHFWAIAWVMDDDYKKAGFELLPSKGGRDKSSAFQAFIYAFSLIPAGMTPWVFGMTGLTSLIICTLAGLAFTWQAWKLYQNCNVSSAKTLMFGSFVYLPLVQLTLVLDRIN
jgi:protoheme IX farnesyltransferase